MRRQILFSAKTSALFMALPAASALLVSALLAPAHADPVIVNYDCVPPLTKGDHMMIDWNAGRNVVAVEFPPSKVSARLSYVASESGFRYERGKISVSGKGDRDVTLQLGKEPVRICTRLPSPDDKPGPQPHSPDIPPPRPGAPPLPDNN
jgi:hypothetical protein